MTANQTGADVVSAAKRISGILSPEPEPTGDSEPVVTEELEATPETLEAPEVSEPSDTQSEVEKYKVKVNGEDLDVTLDDLTKSYMMESDYRQKTMKISEERKALELNQAEVAGKLAEMKQLIEFESSALDSEEMQELRDTDPDDYIRRVEAVKAKAQKYGKFKTEAESRLKAEREQFILEEQQKLIQAIPDFLDQDKLKSETPKITEQLIKAGYTNDELQGLSDHRTFVLARKAMLYDQIMSQSPEEKKINQAPKAAKPATTTTKEDRVSQAQKDTRARLKKTGNVKDAQKAIKNMLR